MPKILKDKEIIEIDSIKSLLEGYGQVIVDLGTGNGKFAYKEAIKNQNIFYIGIDPIGENIIKYYKKKKKKLKRYNLKNLVFVISPIQDIDEDLFNLVDDIYINFPWGSLLEGIVKGEEKLLKNIYSLAKDGGNIHLTFTYSSIYEAGEIERRCLPLLSLEYIDIILRDEFMAMGINILDYGYLEEYKLKSFGTLWSKRIYLTKDRQVYYIEAKVLK